MIVKYQCKWCGRTITKSCGIPLKSKCTKSKTGFHSWVKIQVLKK